MTDTDKKTKGSSIARVLEIIEAVATAERAPSPGDLAYGLDIPKPSVHRILQQLEEGGYVKANRRGQIVPSDRLSRIAMGVTWRGSDKALRQAILQRLSERTGETCGISVPDGAEMVYYERVQSNWPLQIYLPPGSRIPLWCSASGKLYLASLPRARREQLVRHLPLRQLARNTQVDPERLLVELDRIAEEQVGWDDEEFIDGMVACSVPVTDEHGRHLAGVFVHAARLRLSVEGLRPFVPWLREAAAELSALWRRDEVD